MSKSNRIQVDLRGPDGNAFSIISLANTLGKELGWSPQRRGDLNTEMVSGDYSHLIQVFTREFGDLVELLGQEPGPSTQSVHS